MDVTTIKENAVTIAVVHSDDVMISDGQSALDFLASMYYETDCSCIILNKQAVCEDFFKLSTGIAGEILQKVSNYHMKFAIVGDFSKYTSKPLRDFIYESNKGGQVLFVGTEEEALNRFAGR